MRIILANPRGFCAGVNMAIECLDEAIRRFGPNIYVYHEIVHNKYVVDRFTAQGVTFVDNVDEVPHGAILLYSAHGVSPEIRRQARERKLHTIDATCPLVTKVHMEAIKFAKEGYDILLIGHEGHDEVLGTMGEAPRSITLVETQQDVERLDLGPNPRVAFLTQTTLSVDEAGHVIAAIRKKFPDAVAPPKDDICYATTNRQRAVSLLAEQADVVIVLGSQNSSNSQRLREFGEAAGKQAYLIDGLSELQDEWFDDCKTVLVTAGASAPEVVVKECVDHLQQRFNGTVEEVITRTEKVRFPLPKELRVVEPSAS